MATADTLAHGRLFTEAWIETGLGLAVVGAGEVASSRRRGLKPPPPPSVDGVFVASSRRRGLKLQQLSAKDAEIASPLHGGVD